MRSHIYQRIVVLLDGTRTGEQGLGWTRQLARGPDSIVHLLMIRPPSAVVRDGGRVVAFADQLDDAARATALAYLELAATGLREDGLTVTTDVRIGSQGGVIRTAVAELSADIVVASAADPRDLRDVLRHAPVNVLVTGPGCRRSA